MAWLFFQGRRCHPWAFHQGPRSPWRHKRAPPFGAGPDVCQHCAAVEVPVPRHAVEHVDKHLQGQKKRSAGRVACCRHVRLKESAGTGILPLGGAAAAKHIPPSAGGAWAWPAGQLKGRLDHTCRAQACRFFALTTPPHPSSSRCHTLLFRSEDKMLSYVAVRARALTK